MKLSIQDVENHPFQIFSVNVHVGFRKTAESQDVPFDYMCAICHDLLYKPQRCLPCGHIFCDPCLRRLSSIRNRKCPMCREKIEKCLPSPKLSQKLSEKYTSQYEKRFYMEQESEINRYLLHIYYKIKNYFSLNCYFLLVI